MNLARQIAISLLSSTLLCSGSLAAQLPPSQKLSADDLKGMTGEIDRFQDLLRTAPDKCAVMFEIARNYAFGGQYRDAIEWLSRVVDLHAGLDPSRDKVFAKLENTREFQILVQKVREDTPAVRRSRVAFQVAEADLFPENLAYDSQSDEFYFGSTLKDKIVRCNKAGICRPFISAHRDGLGSVLGLKVDPSSKTLWATSNSDQGTSLFRYSLPSGKFLKKYVLTGPHLFNDLVFNSQGEVFVTDTKGGAVYRSVARENQLKQLAVNHKFTAANGIALSSDEKTLYVSAFGDGITVVDITSEATHPLARPSGVCLAYIDGLYFHNRSLIAIQNGPMVPRVVRFKLNPELNRIESLEVLERRNPLFAGVTTGVVASGKFYYMANNQIDKVSDGKVSPDARLNPIKVLELVVPLH